MSAATDLVDDIRATLAANADPQRAAGQQAYMKSTLPYFGIAKPELQRLVREPLARHDLPDAVAWEYVLRTLWDEVTHREHWYAALAVARHCRYRQWAQDVASLPIWEHFVRTGRWWDVCDETASHLFSPLVGAHPQRMAPVVRSWARDDDLWIRRVAVQSQLALKGSTDVDLLAETIEANLDDPTFWMRKAIGWALREFSRYDPQWVRAFVAAHEERLSGLSKREALRRIT